MKASPAQPRASASIDPDTVVGPVSLTVSDPDGNGIEIYRDRPRDEWRRLDGQLEMATLPLGIDSVLGELAESAELQPTPPAQTTVGHVHLQVADIPEAEAFYHGVLGFDVTVRTYPGALFVSAGGYHHHIGLNTWHSRGSAPPAPGSVGLRHFAVRLPGQDALDAVLARIEAVGLPMDTRNGYALVRDPSANGIALTTR